MSTRDMPIRVGIIGLGLIGTRRAQVLIEEGAAALVGVADVDPEKSASASRAYGCDAYGSWRELVDGSAFDAVIVATSNDMLATITGAALLAGKHVLCEKPAGRSVEEARTMQDAAERGRRILAFGFNHRHTAAMLKTREILDAGGIGSPLWIRARYGHGARPGFEREWRANPTKAGGGELLDQGVHLIDLARIFLGPVERAYAVTRTMAWPIQPLEDNAFCVLEHSGGQVTHLHASMTQWKNMFSFEICGDQGMVIVDGLGGSYGKERLIWQRRRPESGPPTEEAFEFEDGLGSWKREWRGFLDALAERVPSVGLAPIASAADGVSVMEVLDALYRSARTGSPTAPTQVEDGVVA